MALSPAQERFLELLVARQALRFAPPDQPFTLKSGRKSPFFINTGCFHHGGDLAALGAAYADALRRRFGDDIAVVFGPAYKGIPLALATAQEYERLVGRPVGWAFDRKEAKDHGEGGSFVGAPLTAGARVALVDDTVTAGTAMREALAKLRGTGVALVGAVVAVDRQERGPNGRPALVELAEEHGLPVTAIVGIGEAVEHLAARGALTVADRDRVLAYLGQR